MSEMSIRRPLELQRLHYWQGQMLRSRDLRDQTTTEDHFRWWHNRALHDAFGIAYGLMVDRQPPGQSRSVVVSPGVAYDCFGRELILQESVSVQVPGSIPDEGLTLLLRFQEPRRLDGHREAEVACLPRSIAPPTRLTSLIWMQSNKVESLDGVPLARINVEGLLVEQVVLPRARALARPLIAHGTTPPGNTAWSLHYVYIRHPIFFILLYLPVEVRVQVDTSAAGFTGVPSYFAWLRGTGGDRRLAAFHNILNPTVDSFTFCMWPSIKGDTLSNSLERVFAVYRLSSAVAERGVSLCWLGIQSAHQDSNHNEVSDVTT
jgi:hypothetical protein